MKPLSIWPLSTAALLCLSLLPTGCEFESEGSSLIEPACGEEMNCERTDMASQADTGGFMTPTPRPDMSASPNPRPDPGNTPMPRPDMNTAPPEPDMSPTPLEDMGPAAPTCSTITACTAGDGCCPASCDVTNDSDCDVDCRDPSTWPINWADEEAALIDLVNIERSQGADCGSRGTFPPASPVQMNLSLQIAARCHSVDMVTNIGGLDHNGSDGSSFSTRARRENYSGSPRGENIAAGNSSASRTVGQWMGSDGHCANIMNADIDRMGIGYFTGNVRFTHYWTMKTGKGGQ